MSARTSVVISVEEAASLIKDGDTLCIGGFVTTNKPLAVLRQLMREGRKNLTLVGPPSTLEVDMMIALGMVSKVSVPYVGAEILAPIGPFYSRWAGRTFKIEEIDLGSLIAMLRAQVQGLPFLPVKGAVGTSLPQLNPTFKPIQDPFGGPPLLAVPPLEPDVAIIHASQADRFGNIQHLGAVFLDPQIAMASKKVIVQVERLVSNEEIRKNPGETSIPSVFVDAVVVAPFGAHPFASQNFYRLDELHIKEYVQAARAFLDGNKGLFEEYINKYIYQPTNHAGYLQAVGWERLMTLGLEDGK